MGISQLLPLLEKSKRVCHVSEFRGQTVAVDTYCWLHKGARSCAMELAKGDPTDSYVVYCMKYVKMLLSYDIKPIMVFDGRHLPAKAKTEEKRREAKKQARKQGMEQLRLGAAGEAYKYFCQCIDVTPEMALALMRECRKIKIDCIVAPYESDAQLAFFSIRGVVDCVISEDSDLLLFGCKKVLYKMDVNGSGQLVETEKIYLDMKMKREQYSFDKFRHMCILSGCDYLDSLPGIGLKKALKFITLTAETNPSLFLDKLPSYLNMRHLVITDDYKFEFCTADATFLHQTVFDPFLKILTPLTPVQCSFNYCKNSGDVFDNDVAYQLALGNLNPLTMEKIADWQPENSIMSEYSIWSGNYRNRPMKQHRPQNKPAPPVVDANAIEQLKSQQDQQFEKEFEFYKTRSVPQTGEPTTSTQESSSVSQECPESPVLSRNPFLKKKFENLRPVPANPDQKVVSRFFFGRQGPSAAEQIREPKTEIDSSPSLNDSYTTSSGSQDLQCPLSPDEPCDLSEMDALNLRSEECLDLCAFSVECECVLEEEEAEIQFVDHSALASVENLPQEKTRKRKHQPEPKVNDKRAKKQLTIEDMLKKMQK